MGFLPTTVCIAFCVNKIYPFLGTVKNISILITDLITSIWKINNRRASAIITRGTVSIYRRSKNSHEKIKNNNQYTYKRKIPEDVFNIHFSTLSLIQ